MSEPAWHVVASGFALPEAPLWEPGTQSLLVSDVVAGGIWRVGEGHKEIVVPHRRGVGGLALHTDGSLVLSGRNLCLRAGDVSRVLALPSSHSATARFNDLTVSEEGRIYVGSIDSEPGGRVNQPGELVMVATNGSVDIVATGLQKTNGLGFSPDGRWLYHVDTGVRTVRRYQVDDAGHLSEPESFARWDRGVPDGLAVAADGSVWVAIADYDGRGVLAVLSPAGETLDWLPTSANSLTSLCFGGDDLRTVFVTVGGAYDRSWQGGRVEAFRSPVAGIARPRATTTIR